MKKVYLRALLLLSFGVLASVLNLGCSKDSGTNGTPPSLSVLTPATGSTLTGGSKNFQITWSGSGIATKKTLEYSLNNGVTWLPITSLSADVLTYAWTVPNVASTKAVVRITDGNGLTASSGLFSITFSNSSGSMVVSAPTSGEVITGGTQNYQIIWSGTGIDAQKTLAYSLDNGSTWTQITTLNSGVTTYNWSVPNTSSTKAIVRITDKNGLTASSGVFTIVGSSGLAVGETDATINGGAFKVLTTKTLKSALTVTVTATLQKKSDATLDSVQLTLIVPIQGSFPYTIDVPTDPGGALINYCLKQYPGGFCNSYKAATGVGTGTIKITSLTPIIEGTFSGTLPFTGGSGSVTITNGAFKAQLN